MLYAVIKLCQFGHRMCFLMPLDTSCSNIQMFGIQYIRNGLWLQVNNTIVLYVRLHLNDGGRKNLGQ
jgi:hypothetical protein